MAGLDGLLLIDKPTGPTSAEVVRILKKALQVKKIGHLGTLDPFASGLLPICLGAGTKLSQFLMAEQKSYTGTLRLGVETDTLDSTGTVTRTAPVPDCPPTLLKKIEQRFSGDYWQTPPMYSALKRKGVPLYKLARQGIEVEREPRRVHVSHLALTLGEPHAIHFSVSCSKGTYIRVLAADIGRALNSVAHLASLRRTAFGTFSIDQAIPLSQARSPQSGQPLPLLSLVQATRSYRTFVVPAPEVALIRRGQQAVLQTLPAARAAGETARILSAEGALIAMVTAEERAWKLSRVFELYTGKTAC